jgi:hypothetical protein
MLKNQHFCRLGLYIGTQHIQWLKNEVEEVLHYDINLIDYKVSSHPKAHPLSNPAVIQRQCQ